MLTALTVLFGAFGVAGLVGLALSLSHRPLPKFPRITRDAALFLGGLAGTAYETVAGKGERPTLLLLYAGMMGLPAFLHQDERKGNGNGAGTSQP